MSTLYSTKVTATGGRHGHIRSEDGLLEMKLAAQRITQNNFQNLSLWPLIVTVSCSLVVTFIDDAQAKICWMAFLWRG